MKTLLILIISLSTLTATAQDTNGDSTITVQLTQRLAQYKLQSIERSYENAAVVNAIRPFAGGGAAPDSLFTVKIKAKFLWPAIDELLSQPTVSGHQDFIRHILNQRIGAAGNAITGYVSLRNQIIAKSNSLVDPDRFAAKWLIDKYTARVSALDAVLSEKIGRPRAEKEQTLSTAIKQ